MENKAEEIFLRKKIRENYSVPENFYLQHFDYLNAEKVLSWLKEYASQQKPEIIKSDNSKINISLLEEVERLRKIETSCIKLLAYGQKQIELNREAVDLIKSDELKPEQTKVFQFRLAQGKFYGWRDSMKFLNEALNK